MKRDFIYLASASPRRGELLSQIGVTFRVIPANVPEIPLPAEQPPEFVSRVARGKADAVWETVASSNEPAPVLAADTVVVIAGEILGKPGTHGAAMRMLESLSGRSHLVLTSVALRFGEEKESLLTSNEVRFRATTADERRAYCDTEEPLDKAGGYGIQGFGAVFIERLIGSYSAVMGLPLYETARLLDRFDIPLWLKPKRA